MTLSEMLRFQAANLLGAAVAGLLAWEFPIVRELLGTTVWAVVSIVGIYLFLVFPDVRRRKKGTP
jgi:hypothetical protein